MEIPKYNLKSQSFCKQVSAIERHVIYIASFCTLSNLVYNEGSSISRKINVYFKEIELSTVL